MGALDGAGVAQAILDFSEKQSCTNPAAFLDDMGSMFSKWDIDYLREYTPDVISSVMESVRRHQVALKGVVSTVRLVVLSAVCEQILVCI